MPTYEYRCAKCGNHLEVFQSFSEEPLTKHEGCGGRLAKVLSPAGIVLKGSGFYKTDNRSGTGRKKSAAAAEGETKSGSESPSTGSESKSADSKASSASSKSKSSSSDAKSA
jgi:putative FmdB family regulatory protein